MIEIFLCLLLSGIVSILTIPIIIKIANSRDFHDIPDERKVHTHKVPTLGGIGIFLGFMTSALIWTYFLELTQFKYMLAAFVIIIMVGMLDDFISLRPMIKLVGQVGAALMLVYAADIRVTHLDGFLGIYEVDIFPGYLITACTIVIITNAFNLIDGLDGLAGTVAVVVFGFFGIWFAGAGDKLMPIICFSLVGAVIGFLRYNYHKKIFMGDTGSLLLGFVAATMVVVFIHTNQALPNNNLLHLSNPISVGVALLIYPLFDTLRVFTIRLREGRSPFSADRNHIHHLLLNLGFSHLRATTAICFINTLFVALALACDGLNDNYLVPVVVFVAYLIAAYIKSKSDKRMEAVAKKADSLKYKV